VERGSRDLQLLEVAVIYVVTAPVWHSIELDAVRELHNVVLEESFELLPSPPVLRGAPVVPLVVKCSRES